MQSLKNITTIVHVMEKTQSGNIFATEPQSDEKLLRVCSVYHDISLQNWVLGAAVYWQEWLISLVLGHSSCVVRATELVYR